MILKIFKQVLLICALQQIGSLFFSQLAQAQSRVTTSEIGVGIGGANYKGELSPNYRFLNNQPAVTAFYRRDISSAITARGGLMLSHRVIDDNTFSDEAYDLPLHNWRQAEARLSFAEVSLVGEYNFLDYYDLRQRLRISPYFFAGIAGLIYNIKVTTENPDLQPVLDKPYETNVAISVPFGVGVKYALSKHWNLGLEFGARKLFMDRLDNVYEIDGKRIANPFDNDWYFYNGISLSYTIYRVNCPPPYKNKTGILD
ncbi:type IX secretion system protein PorG [Pontibacter sp. H249]|uniref:type IX secretion system protein PorG n=1 Tax=Pontibacter sp. H249 TaxID=3133420 RepID=UPI0030C3CC74